MYIRTQRALAVGVSEGDPHSPRKRYDAGRIRRRLMAKTYNEAEFRYWLETQCKAEFDRFHCVIERKKVDFSMQIDQNKPSEVGL